MHEGDEQQQVDPEPGAAQPVDDNSLGRLLTLTDGVFAIAITLLALDLKVPDLGRHAHEDDLVHALAANADSYWSYLLTFYVIAQYWLRHRRVLRSVTEAQPLLFRDTLLLLLIVAAMPFPASLLGNYGGEPISLALYGAANVVAMLTLILTSWDVRRLGLTAAPQPGDEDFHRKPRPGSLFSSSSSASRPDSCLAATDPMCSSSSLSRAGYPRVIGERRRLTRRQPAPRPRDRTRPTHAANTEVVAVGD